MTPGKSDDLAAYTLAIATKRMAASAHDWLKFPIADEMVKLAGIVQRLNTNKDGFNLTVADQHCRRRDDGGTRPGGVRADVPLHRRARRDYWGFRQTVLAG